MGNSFSIPTTPVNCILVGGGYGSAPLFALAEKLKARGCKVDMLLGASTAAKVFAPIEGKRTVDSLSIITEDGSTGLPGKVTDYLSQLITNSKADIVYSCGPMGMMAALTEITKKHNIYHHVSIEESMSCGIGICMACVVPIKNSNGIFEMKRSCIDGPIVDGELVGWEAKGKLLPNTWGHDEF